MLPDGLLLDVTGCAHLFGGEATMLGVATAALARHGITVRAVLAGNAAARRRSHELPGRMLRSGEIRSSERSRHFLSVPCGCHRLA